VIKVALNGRRLDGTQMRMTRAGALLVVLALSAPAAAQPSGPPTPAPSSAPVDPYAAPPGQDPVLAEQIAEQLVSRAQELIDAKLWVDAKQLAVEALVQSPKGTASERARYIIKLVNQQLGIADETTAPPPAPTPPVEPPPSNPITDPTAPPPITAPPTAEGPRHDGELAATIHGGFVGALLGATIGSAIDSANPQNTAIPLGLVGGLGGALLTQKLVGHKLDEAQVRTVGSGTIWGAVAGGFFADVVQGANGGEVTAPGILLGGTIGALAGGVGGTLLARDHKLTRGDVALVDTFAGMGTLGGLTIGMLMQPAQGEAYSLNAVLGAGAGVVVGLVMAPKTNTTPRRMLRVAGLSLAGGAVPFALYAAIRTDGSTADERTTGALATIGLVGGAWLGFYLTRHMDEGLDVPDGGTAPVHKDDAPPAVVGRSSDGHWSLGGIGVMPTSRALAPQAGMTFTLAGATF
jgi:hypothetical protein